MDNKLLSLIVEKPKDYPTFMVRDELVWKQNFQGDEVLCLPRDHQLIVDILMQAHKKWAILGINKQMNTFPFGTGGHIAPKTSENSA